MNFKNPTLQTIRLIFYSSRATFLTQRRGVYENNVILMTDRPTSHFGKLQTAISRQRVIRSTSCLVPGQGFRGRRIEWRYFRFHQIQDGGWPPFWKISNDHISATDNLIRFIFFIFDSIQGRFSRSADRMALLPVGLNPRSQPSAVLHNFEWPYL